MNGLKMFLILKAAAGMKGLTSPLQHSVFNVKTYVIPSSFMAGSSDHSHESYLTKSK